jgi:hypothetical protein
MIKELKFEIKSLGKHLDMVTSKDKQEKKLQNRNALKAYFKSLDTNNKRKLKEYIINHQTKTAK